LTDKSIDQFVNLAIKIKNKINSPINQLTGYPVYQLI